MTEIYRHASDELMKVCTSEDYDCDNIRCDECEHFLGEPSTWIKEYAKEVLLGGESVLPYICENNTNCESQKQVRELETAVENLPENKSEWD